MCCFPVSGLGVMEPICCYCSFHYFRPRCRTTSWREMSTAVHWAAPDCCASGPPGGGGGHLQKSVMQPDTRGSQYPTGTPCPSGDSR